MANIKIKPPTTVMLTADGDLYLAWQEDENVDFAVSLLVCRYTSTYAAGTLYNIKTGRQYDKKLFFSSLEENFKEEDAPKEEDFH